MEKKYILDIVMNKEKLSDGSPIFVVYCPSLGVVSQGKDVDEAIKNIKEAVEYTLKSNLRNLMSFWKIKNIIYLQL